MVTIYGPSCRPTVPPKGNKDLLFPALEPLSVQAETLEEALAAYTREFGARFRPYDGSLPLVPFALGEPAKYFWYERENGSSLLVDIHIERDRETLCPKQDLSFLLQPDDQVCIGPLAC